MGELSTNERDATPEEMESIYGPVVGTFTVRERAKPLFGQQHPEEVATAWAGIALPIRDGFTWSVGSKTYVRVFAIDGFNALVNTGASESVLQYWIDNLVPNAFARFHFDSKDGDLHEYKDDDES